MSNEHVIERLKAIRSQAGLTVRSMGQLLGLSASGYQHYENADRFKEPFLPMELARKIAAVVGPRGVDRDEVMALAGLPEAQSTPADRRNTFAEGDAIPWHGQPGQESDFAKIIAQLAPTAGNRGSYRVARDMLGVGLLTGDIVVIDRRAAPETGQLALGNARAESGQMVAVIGRVFGDMLITMESLTTGTTLDLNSPDVAVYHPIIAQFRTM